MKRLPPLPPTSGTRGMDARMLACLSLCSPCGRFGTNSGCIWKPLVTGGITWDGPCKLVEAFGLDWLAGYPNKPFGILCRGEPRFREICWILGPESWHPVASFGSLLHPSRSPIEEDKMIRFQDSSCLGARRVGFLDFSCPGTQILDPSCLGAWRLGFLDVSCLAAWAGWTDVLCWALLRGLGVGRAWMF